MNSRPSIHCGPAFAFEIAPGFLASFLRVTARIVAGLWLALSATAPALDVVVEVEEEVYRYEPADNGAGPMWCGGSTCVVRLGNDVYATGLETIPGAKPLNNCRWVLWRRGDTGGWERAFVDEGRTREPSPLACFRDGSVLVSANPTLTGPDRTGGGPARPEVLRWFAAKAGTPERWLPGWKGEPVFSEHSYRSLASDGTAGELIAFQNVDSTHAEWAFRDGEGRWSASGRLKWPWGAEYAKPQPIRICYPNVALRGRVVHFFGVSDIIEPNPAWRAFKRELTGKEWDYDFRRLFYTWTPDVSREGFREWVEVAGREETCGWLWPCDVWVAPDGAAHVLWTERAIDERLRARFFPAARQEHALRYAIMRDGKVGARRTLLVSTEDKPGMTASAARFQELADGRLLVICHVVSGGAQGNRVFLLGEGGEPGPMAEVGFAKPFTSFFTATPRAGAAPSDVIDLLGVRAGTGNAIGYARIRVRGGVGGAK